MGTMGDEHIMPQGEPPIWGKGQGGGHTLASHGAGAQIWSPDGN